MRILAADDEADMRLLLEVALGMDPAHHVTIVASGEEAIACARLGIYDLVLLDGLMPGLDGVETCRRLKADPVTATLPVVFLTALNSPESRAAFVGVGAAGFIEKPFDPFTLTAQLVPFVAP